MVDGRKRAGSRIQKIDNTPFKGTLIYDHMFLTRSSFHSEWIHKESGIRVPMFMAETAKIFALSDLSVTAYWKFKKSSSNKLGITSVDPETEIEEDPWLLHSMVKQELDGTKRVLKSLMQERDALDDQIQTLCDSLGIARNGPLDQSWIDKVADALDSTV